MIKYNLFLFILYYLMSIKKYDAYALCNYTSRYVSLQFN